MATFFAMPKLGLNMVEGRIVNWLVDEGSKVKAGQPIVEIETDKATNEMEAPVAGIVGKILHHDGEDVPCNGVLAVLLDENEELPKEIPTMVGEEVAPAICLKADFSEGRASLEERQESQQDGRIIISPSAKKLARELGVDIGKITPSGNQIKREDVERAYEQMAEATNRQFDTTMDAVKKPYSGIRKLTGDHMSQSVHTTARVALNLDVNAEKLMATRKKFIDADKKISFNVLVTYAVAKALREFPYMNSRLVEDEIWELSKINIGFAVDSDRGLMVPVIKDADKKDLETLQNEFSSLAERALAGKSSPEDLENGTFTITNLGAQEIESFIPVINLPECAILAVGAIMPKAVVIEGDVRACQMMTFTLVFDHRIVDGTGAAKFLQRVKHLLEAE